MEIKKLHGTEDELYRLVSPLVMNPMVLRQNNNFPFRTSDKFEWYIAMSDDAVQGFFPVEYKLGGPIINNYYIRNHKKEVLQALLERVTREADNDKKPLFAISLNEDAPIFQLYGFTNTKVWTRYIKMYRGPKT